jgi:hypothetical protein
MSQPSRTPARAARDVRNLHEGVGIGAEAMRHLLVLLVAVTTACGVAASVAVLVAPADVGDIAECY